MHPKHHPLRDLRDFFPRTLHIFVETVKGFFAANIGDMGAALAFYTTLAVAPLLVIAISAASIVFSNGDARDRIISQISSLAGPQAAEALKHMESPENASTNLIATWVGIGTLLFGALGVFYHLQNSLNSIWKIPPMAKSSWMKVLRKRLFSLATVMITGFLLLVSLVLSATLSWLGAQTISRLGLPVATLEVTNVVLSFVIVAFLFALIFKLLPDTHVAWSDVWLGALLTAFLFSVGKVGFGIYIGRSNVTSAYGAAGSLVALLLWSYYAAQIAFFGAEFTHVSAEVNAQRNPRSEVNHRKVKRTLL